MRNRKIGKQIAESFSVKNFPGTCVPHLVPHLQYYQMHRTYNKLAPLHRLNAGLPLRNLEIRCVFRNNSTNRYTNPSHDHSDDKPKNHDSPVHTSEGRPSKGLGEDAAYGYETRSVELVFLCENAVKLKSAEALYAIQKLLFSSVDPNITASKTMFLISSRHFPAATTTSLDSILSKNRAPPSAVSVPAATPEMWVKDAQNAPCRFTICTVCPNRNMLQVQLRG